MEDKSLREIAKELQDGGMCCTCDLDNWQPEKSGHSCVCQIDKEAFFLKYGVRRADPLKW